MKNQNSYSIATVLLVSLMTGCSGNLNFYNASEIHLYEYNNVSVTNQLTLTIVKQKVSSISTFKIYS